MGNSGSVHHMQSGLKELHTYYQDQSNDDVGATGSGADDFSFLKDEQKYSNKSNPLMLRTSTNRLKGITPSTTTKTSGVNSSHHIKVLPSLSENLRLRSTTNGAILHSGGTISCRRESLLPQPPSLMPERSRTFIVDNSEACLDRNPPSGRMQRRSQTQLDIDVRRRNPDKMLDDDFNYKRFNSNLDLRRASMANENIENYPNETYQNLSKVKIRTKKRKAPSVPAPALSSEILPIIIDQSNDLDRKKRLFKTKTETTANHLRQQPIKRSQRELSKELPEPAVVMRSNLNQGMRREKSFDAQLLSSEMARNNKHHLQRELKPSLVEASRTIKTKSLQKSKSTPIVDNKMEKSDFKIELEVATKFRYRSMTKTTDPLARQRDPNEDQRKLVSPPASSRANRPETQSKIPQLKKTFYFGMESSKRKPSTTIKVLTKDSSRKIASPSTVLDDTIVTSSSLSKEHDEVYSLNHKHDSEVVNDNGLQLNVRPTLPRRQLEIPRFSPVAAWRTLSVADELQKEQHQRLTASTSPSPQSLNAAIETANTFLIEDRIHRNYRGPCPFYPDNKSGDSGISGDDGYIVEKPIQPQSLEHVQNNYCHELANFDSSFPVDELVAPPVKVVGPFLAAWTPQQDLEDDEDSSSDGGGGGGEMAVNMADPHTPTSPHVFSLSLPRENQLSAYGEKNKLDYRSLQKLKRTTSGDLNDFNGGCNLSSLGSQHSLVPFGGDNAFSGTNFRSDNWVLSKTTGMTPAPTDPNTDPKICVDRVDSSNVVEGSSYFDRSVSIQPMSLGSLAIGKHVMYLPNQTTGSEFKRQSAAATAAIRPTSWNLSNKYENSLEDLFGKNIPTRNKRFSFQSSLRQIERRRLAEKLSKEADQKEALRKSELEAMRRVEEEFQKKRAYEKASIRHQLRLYSMDDDNFMSLPNLNDYRAEPDGAVSSASELSPVFQTSPSTKRKNL